MSEVSYVSLCRLCQRTASWYIDIFHASGTRGMHIYELIKDLLQVEVHAKDGLPSTACNDCFVKLEEFYDFKEMCAKTATELRTKCLKSKEALPPQRCVVQMESVSCEENHSDWDSTVAAGGSSNNDDDGVGQPDVDPLCDVSIKEEETVIIEKAVEDATNADEEVKEREPENVHASQHVLAKRPVRKKKKAARVRRSKLKALSTICRDGSTGDPDGSETQMAGKRRTIRKSRGPKAKRPLRSQPRMSLRSSGKFEDGVEGSQVMSLPVITRKRRKVVPGTTDVEAAGNGMEQCLNSTESKSAAQKKVVLETADVEAAGKGMEQCLEGHQALSLPVVSRMRKKVVPETTDVEVLGKSIEQCLNSTESMSITQKKVVRETSDVEAARKGMEQCLEGSQALSIPVVSRKRKKVVRETADVEAAGKGVEQCLNSTESKSTTQNACVPCSVVIDFRKGKIVRLSPCEEKSELSVEDGGSDRVSIAASKADTASNVGVKRKNTEVVGFISTETFGTYTRSKGGYLCDECRMEFSSKALIIKHMKVHCGVDLYHCGTCNVDFSDRGPFEMHNYVNHGIIQLEYPTSEEEEANVDSVVHSEETGVACGVNADRGKKSRKYRKRRRKFTRNKTRRGQNKCEDKFACEFCGVSYPCMENLQEHRKTHTDSIFLCQICRNQYDQKSQLRSHIVQEHFDPMHFPCVTCNAAYQLQSDLLSHQSAHVLKRSETVERGQFRCRVCARIFRAKCNLERHMSAHFGERSNKCRICFKSFVQRSDLVSHAAVHNGNKVHKCRLCPRSFCLKTQLRQHLGWHTRGRYASEMNLRLRMPTLSDQRRYPCPLCHKWFSLHSKLKEHLSFHSLGEKFPCNACPEVFPSLKCLSKHTEQFHVGLANHSSGAEKLAIRKKCRKPRPFYVPERPLRLRPHRLNDSQLL